MVVQTADEALVTEALFVERSGAISINIFISECLQMVKVAWVAQVAGLQELMEFDFEMVDDAHVVGYGGSCVLVVVSVDVVCGV